MRSWPVARAATLSALSKVARKNVVGLELQGAGEMCGVVAAQRVLCGQVSGVAEQRFVDRDGAQLGIEILERRDRAAVRLFADTALATSRRLVATPNCWSIGSWPAGPAPAGSAISR